MHLPAWHIAAISIICLSLFVYALDLEYIIYPDDNLSDTEVQALTEILSKFAGDSQHLYASKMPWSTSKAPAYWLAKLPLSVVDIIQKTKGVQILGSNLLNYTDRLI